MWFTAALGLFSKIGSALTGIDFNAIGNILKAIGASMIKYWYLWIIGVLLSLNIVTGYEFKTTKDNLAKEVTAHVKDIQDFKTAQETANANAISIQTTLTKESQDNADKADSDYSSLLGKYRASLVRYGAGQGGAKQSGDHQLSTAQSGNGSGASSQFPQGLTISGADADVCAVNTARLVAVHDWAVNLPKEVK